MPLSFNFQKYVKSDLRNCTRQKLLASINIIKTSLGLKVFWLSVRTLLWTSFLLQQSQLAEAEVCHMVAAAAARVTIKVNKCLLKRTVQTGRAMILLTLSVISREMLQCVQRHSFVSLRAARHAWTWSPVSDRGVEGDKGGASPAWIFLRLDRLDSGHTSVPAQKRQGKRQPQPF